MTRLTKSTARYSVGMIGVGRKGTAHANGYTHHPMTEVVDAADPDEANLELFCRRFNIKAAYTDYKEMLRKEKLDIVAPILPVSVNPEVVIDCARAPGVRAIFCEKPMAARLSDADAMVDECRSRGIYFAAGDAYRSFRQLWAARKMMEAGDLGEVKSIHLFQSTDEISGGGCQGLSVIRMFAWDAEVDWLTGWVSDDPFSEHDQAMGGMVRFKNGIDAYVDFQPVGKKGIEINCTKGYLFADWWSFRLWKTKDGKIPRRFDEMHEVTGLFGPGLEDDRGRDAQGRLLPGNRQMDSIQSIVDSLELGIEPRCSGENMRKVLEITLALRESARRNHAPVRVPLEDRSLTIFPDRSRWLNKKGVLGAEEYAKQIGNFDRK